MNDSQRRTLESAQYYLKICLERQEELKKHKTKNYEMLLNMLKQTELDCREMIAEFEAVDKPSRSPEVSDRFSDLGE